MAKSFKEFYEDKAQKTTQKPEPAPFRDFLKEKSLLEEKQVITEDAATPFRMLNGVFQYSLNENWVDLFSIEALRGADGADGLIGSNGVDGKDGRDIEIVRNGSLIQWRYAGEDKIRNLFSLKELVVESGLVAV